VAMTGTQKYASKPIEILSQDTTEVKFSVIQSWLDHPACYVATDYISTTDGQTCERADNVAPGQIGTYTALCSNGVAQVTIYVHSSDFDGMEDNATVPGRCDPVVVGQTVAYTFDIPCGVEEGSDACEPTPELTCDHFDSQIISSEDFEMSEQAQSWLFATTGSASSLNLGADSPEVSKTFEVPMDSSEITLEFDFYESNGWASDEVFIRINAVYLDLISYISGTSEGTKTGTFGELAVSITTSGNNHHMQLTIPDIWYPDGLLTLGFKVSTSVAGETVGFDNVVLSSACAAVLAVSSSVVCPADGGDREISFEDFEDGEAETWTMGLESEGSGFTTFLGRLGQQNPEVSKDFPVPDRAASVVLAFDFYNIDGFSPTDKAYVKISGVYIDLGLFGSFVSGSANYNDITMTKTAGSKQNIGFSADELDQKYHVEMTIPTGWYTSGMLEIGFKVVMEQVTDATGAGIDNIRLTANCESLQRRDLEQAVLPQTTSVTEPDMYANDGGFYCSEDDFPCKGDGNVYVCHYDARRGYQTFCLPESDSDVLRFYANDYCGPCIGGYGGINAN
jgi:hypothetical protein